MAELRCLNDAMFRRSEGERSAINFMAIKRFELISLAPGEAPDAFIALRGVSPLKKFERDAARKHQAAV